MLHNKRVPVAVECYFADDYADRVRNLWNNIESRIPDLGYRPHFSLAVFSDDIDIEVLRSVVEEFSKQLEEFDVKVTSLGAFCTDPAVLFLAIALDNQLIEIHAKLHGPLAIHNLCPIPYYLPGNWTPHITLDQWLDHDALGRSVTKAAPHCPALIAAAKVVEVGIIRCNPVEEVWTRTLTSG